MFFLFSAMVLVAWGLLAYGARTPAIYSASAIFLFAGIGMLAAALHPDQFYPASLLFVLKRPLGLLSFYGFACSFLLFSLHYSSLFRKTFIAKTTFVVVILSFVMFVKSLLLEVPLVIHRIEYTWNGLYLLAGCLVLLVAVFREPNDIIRKNRIYTIVVFVPPVVMILLFHYVMPLFGDFEWFKYDRAVVVPALLLFIVVWLRRGIIGVRIIMHHDKDASTGKFLMVNHALKHDIGKIRLFCEKLKMYDSGKVNQQIRSDIVRIEEAGRRMSELLDHFKAKIMKIQIKQTQSDLSTMIDHLLFTFEPVLENIDVSVKVEHVQLSYDLKHMQEVISNLIINAVESMPDGGKLVIQSKPSKSGVTLMIKDTGTGIAEHYLPHIFEPYFTTKVKQGENEGLGLAYCREVVRKHGGTITAESRLQKGTVMKIWLPGTKYAKSKNLFPYMQKRLASPTEKPIEAGDEMDGCK
ncbi:MAG TPA: HAMP domain-containing sensor histidine kinase [Bacillales bacterium]|nr:HAMP domain-containing sensor histidine kinase [Bacillales bacterium]